MKFYLLLLFCLFLSVVSYAQGIQYSSAVPHCNVTPVNAPTTFGSWLRYDRNSHLLYQWTGVAWVLSSGAATVVDGDYGDITVSGSGLVWNIDPGVVGPPELASTSVTAGTYGSATNVPQFTVDADGRITGASNVAISVSSTVLDGDYNDITVSGSGLVWNIDSGVVGPPELASTAVTAGTYGSGTNVPQFTVDADGRITNASNVAITIPAIVADGDYNDITVSGTGLVWNIDSGVVGPPELASTAVTAGTYGSATDVPQFTVDADGRITLASNVAISVPSGLSVITPPVITTDQDNYSPTGWAGATTVRLSFDSDSDAITSFLAGTSGEKKTLRNVGLNYGYIPSEHPDGTAGNRVSGFLDYILEPSGSIVLEYDGTISRWVVVSSTFNPETYGTGHSYSISAGSITEADYDALGLRVAGGLLSGTTGGGGLPGVINLSTSVSATGTATMYFTKVALTPTTYGLSHIFFSTWVYFPLLSDAAQRYTAQSGFSPIPNSSGIDVNGTIAFRYSDDINGGRWEGFVRNESGVETVVDLGISVAGVTPYLLTLCYDKNKSEARFYINGSYSGRLISGFPSSTTNCGVRSIMIKRVGTLARLYSIANFRFYTVF